MNIKHVEIKRKKSLKELQTLESKTYTLFDHSQYIQDMKRAEYLRGQISLYEDIMIDLMEEQ
jgi:hypothetical protein